MSDEIMTDGDKKNAEDEKDVIGQLRSVDVNHLVEVLLAENLHTQTLVISSLPDSMAAGVLERLPAQNQVAIVEKLAVGDRIQKDLLDLTLKSVLQKVRELAEKNYVSVGGIEFAVSLMNMLPASAENVILSDLSEKNADVAEEIKKRLFVFEDIVMLDDRSIQKILREVDSSELAKAMKGTDEEVQDKIFRNMSKNAAAMLKEDIEFMGPIREIDRDEAQSHIVSIIRRLEEYGEIVILRGNELDCLG